LHVSPYFHKIYKLPHVSAKFIHFALFPQNLRRFGLIYVFLLPPPCFDHEAFMHHALHVLDASAGYDFELNYLEVG